jgi:hypothetical protein
MPRRHPHPYQRPPAVAPDPPRRAPRSGTGLVLKIALGVFIGGLALAAAAYFALAQPWKSAENCATNIAGQKMCGGDLLAFCERHYDPQVNGDACRPTLRDAGQDTAAVRRRVRRAEQVAIFGRKTTMSGALGDELWLSAPPDDLGVRITAHSSPPVGEYDEPSGDTRFVGVWYTLENQSDRTVTASPAQSITVIDTAGRQADPAVDRPVAPRPCVNRGLIQVGNDEAPGGAGGFGVRTQEAVGGSICAGPDGQSRARSASSAARSRPAGVRWSAPSHSGLMIAHASSQ